MKLNHPHTSHFGAELGASEKRTELYTWYCEGALQLATTPCTKSASGVISSADEQAGAVRSMRDEK